MNGYWRNTVIGCLIASVAALGSYGIYLNEVKADDAEAKEAHAKIDSRVEQNVVTTSILIQAVKMLTLNECLKEHTRQNCLDLYGHDSE